MLFLGNSPPLISKHVLRSTFENSVLRLINLGLVSLPHIPLPHCIGTQLLKPQNLIHQYEIDTPPQHRRFALKDQDLADHPFRFRAEYLFQPLILQGLDKLPQPAECVIEGGHDLLRASYPDHMVARICVGG